MVVPNVNSPFINANQLPQLQNMNFYKQKNLPIVADFI